MKKLLVLALFGASMQAMDKMDLCSSAELIKSLVEGELEVAGNEISTPSGQRYTLDAFHEGLKDHGVIIDGDQMTIDPTTATHYGKNLASFLFNEDIAYLTEQGMQLDEEIVEAVITCRDQLVIGLVTKNPFALIAGLQGPLHINPDSLQ